MYLEDKQLKKVKVLVIYPFLHHYRLGVFREMDKTEGYEYTFVSGLEGQRGIKALSSDAVSNHEYAPVRVVGPFSWQSKVPPMLSRWDYDAVIFLADIPSISTWIGAAIARSRRKPVLFWTIGWHRPESGIKRILRNSFYRLSNMLLLYGELGKSIGTQMKFPPERMSVIGNSVETASAEKSQSEDWHFMKPPKTYVIGAVIRLTPVKHLDLLIRAAAQVVQDDPTIELKILLVGEGPERDKLQQLADELKIDLVMPGALYGARALTNVYEAMDVTVVPSAVGLTAIQSMSHGVPVISNDSAYTQMPEWESIKPGITGELFPEGDVHGLAAAIRRLTALSAEQRNEMAINCKLEVQNNWSAEVQAKRLANIISEYFPETRPRSA
ncbi:glycosyltransferase family 4 protein [Corynebacteriaceae bacterium 6-324]